MDAVIRARLGRLRPEQRRALEAGSVIGRTFWGGAVGAITGTQVQDACRRVTNKVSAWLTKSPPTIA